MAHALRGTLTSGKGLRAGFSKEGQPPLAAHETGRAATLEVAVRRAPVVPPARGRSGELHPAYQGLSLKHALWYRQLRRIQALKQAVRKGTPSPSAMEHPASLWHSILRGPGFSGSFASWYPRRPVALPCDLPAVPVTLPALHEVDVLFLTFQANVDHLEKNLSKIRKRDARAKRANIPFLVFKDIKAEGPSPVETLVEGPPVKVVETCPEESAVVLSEAASFDVQRHVCVDQKVCRLIHAEPDKLWLDTVDAVPAGALVQQDTLVGSLTDLFRVVGREWGRRWSKHLHVEADRWRKAVDCTVLPEAVPEADFPDITPDLWRTEVRRRKASSAAGLDGITRQDLLLMPDDLLHLILDVYRHAEFCGEWPEQATQAVISALEKRPNASRVEHYRPITIMNLVYRIWSSIRSRQCLRHLLQFCICHTDPPHPCGMPLKPPLSWLGGLGLRGPGS